MTVLTAGGMALMRRHVRVEDVAGTRITRTQHGASIPQVSAKPFNSNNKECRRNTRGDRKGGGGGWSRGAYLIIVNLRNRTGEERRRQTLCDKRDNNFV